MHVKFDMHHNFSDNISGSYNEIKDVVYYTVIRNLNNLIQDFDLGIIVENKSKCGISYIAEDKIYGTYYFSFNIVTSIKNSSKMLKSIVDYIQENLDSVVLKDAYENESIEFIKPTKVSGIII